MQHTIHSFPRCSLVMVKVCLLVLGWCADGNNRQILYVGNNRGAQTLAHTRTRFLYVKNLRFLDHTRDFFRLLCAKMVGWFFFGFNNTIFCRHPRKTRRRCAPFVCVREQRSPVWVCLMMRKEKLEFSCNLPALLSTRKKVPCSGMFWKSGLCFFLARESQNYCFWNGLLEPCKGERNSRFQSPIKVGPPKWEHREKPHGDVYSSQGLLRWHFSFLNLAFSVCCFSFFIICSFVGQWHPLFLRENPALHPLFWDSLVWLVYPDSIDQTHRQKATHAHTSRITITENRTFSVFLFELTKNGNSVHIFPRKPHQLRSTQAMVTSFRKTFKNFNKISAKQWNFPSFRSQ